MSRPTSTAPSRPKPACAALILFLDFDGTLSTHDTLAALAAVPSAYKLRSPRSFQGAEKASGPVAGAATPTQGSGQGLGAEYSNSNGGVAGEGSGDDRVVRGKEDGDAGRNRDEDGDAERDGRQNGGREWDLEAKCKTDVCVRNKENPDFTALTEQYLSALRKHKENYIPRERERTTVEEELAWLESLRPVEEESIRRVEASGLFADLTREIIRKGAWDAIKSPPPSTPSQTPEIPRVEVRKDAKRCVEQVLSHGRMRSGLGGEDGGGEVHIESVNWSRTWIEALLSAAWTEGGTYTSAHEALPKSVRIAEIEIAVNELDWGEGGVSNGRLDRWWEEKCHEKGNAGTRGGIWTAGDKARVVRNVLVKMGERAKSVYVGDSVTDLSALLEVDVGICLRDGKDRGGGEVGGVGGAEREMSAGQKELKGTLERCGVSCEWIGKWRERRMKRGGRRRLWWAKGFKEIWESGVLSEEWDAGVDREVAGKMIGEGNAPVEKLWEAGDSR